MVDYRLLVEITKGTTWEHLVYTRASLSLGSDVTIVQCQDYSTRNIYFTARQYNAIVGLTIALTPSSSDERYQRGCPGKSIAGAKAYTRQGFEGKGEMSGQEALRANDALWYAFYDARTTTER